MSTIMLTLLLPPIKAGTMSLSIYLSKTIITGNLPSRFTIRSCSIKATPIPGSPFSQSRLNKTKRNPILLFSPLVLELANPSCTKGSPLEIPEDVDDTKEPVGESNKWVVRALYEALNSRDVETVHKLLAPNIEWWFHGPPSHQHMMRLLTGRSEEISFHFVPLSIESFGPSTVLVEGSDRALSVLWVHAWTVGSDGIITKVREYFNTSVTVTTLAATATATSSTLLKKKKTRKLYNTLPVWQSRLHEEAGKSLPGLVLAL